MNADGTITTSTGMLGTIISWKVPKEVALDDLRRELAREGFDEELAGDLMPQNALKRALREMAGEGRIIRPVPAAKLPQSTIFVAQFTREYLDSAIPGRLLYDREATVSLMEDGTIVADIQELADHLRDLAREHTAKRGTSDLTRLVQRIMDAYKADLVPIREQGGAYFVPASHADLVRRCRNLLIAIGGKLRSFDVRLGSEETRESVADSMAEYMGDLLKGFEESIAEINGDSRSDAITRRKAAIGSIRARLETYAELLGGWASGIRAKIDAGENALLAKLAESVKPEPEPEPEPEPVDTEPVEYAPTDSVVTDPITEPEPDAPKAEMYEICPGCGHTMIDCHCPPGDSWDEFVK